MERYQEILDRQILRILLCLSKASGLPDILLRDSLQELKRHFLGMLFGRLYDEHLVLSKPYPYFFLGRLKKIKGWLLAEGGRMEDDPFMIVLPPTMVPTPKKVEHISTRGKCGSMHLLPYLLSDARNVPAVPTSPYILTGLNCGREFLEKSHAYITHRLWQDSRSYPFTADEGSMLAFYRPNLLYDAPLILWGSEYDQSGVPVLTLDSEDGEERAKLLFGDKEHMRGHAPSYYDRFEIDWRILKFKEELHHTGAANAQAIALSRRS